MTQEINVIKVWGFFCIHLFPHQPKPILPESLFISLLNELIQDIIEHSFWLYPTHQTLTKDHILYKQGGFLILLLNMILYSTHHNTSEIKCK